MGAKEKKSTASRIRYTITLIILLIILYFAYQYYQTNNFNDYVRSETNVYTSEFIRDKKVKYSNAKSYKITSPQMNDAMFYQSIEVRKNQPYKVTCMVKTNEVVSDTENSGIGAQISVAGTTERSVAIKGTQDWQKIELLFNSKDREQIDIGFRLGGYLGEATGEAWFSDFTIEEGTIENNNEWNFACFIFEQTDVTIDANQVKLAVTQNEISDITTTIQRFEEAATALSNNKMTANCDIYTVDTPLSSLSYSNEFGYFVSPEDIEKQIKEVIEANDYDHIFAVIKLGNEEYIDDIQVNDWIGLGSMDYYGVGFSNIRLPNDSRSYIYQYNPRINQFPEEVLLHEFLHSLERNAEEYGFERPELHDYAKYGYRNEALVGQRRWYIDYMNQNITTSEGKIGLPEEIYTLKPAKRSNFNYTYELENVFEEPENIIEEIKMIFANLGNKIEYITNK